MHAFMHENSLVQFSNTANWAPFYGERVRIMQHNPIVQGCVSWRWRAQRDRHRSGSGHCITVTRTAVTAVTALQ